MVSYAWFTKRAFLVSASIIQKPSCRSIRSKTKSFEVCGRANTNVRSIFVELRDNRYAVCWCELEGNHLLLVPSPKSPVPIRHLRYPQDADIVGRVVGFAHLIAPLHSKTVAAPSPGTGVL